MEIRVLIYEDNKMVRDAMQIILNGSAGYCCCGAYADGNHWERDLNGIKPDVVLMDIELPGINGVELTRRIRERFPEVKVLIQTVFNDSDKIFRAICAGASGYLLKTDPPQKYLEAINEVYNGGAPMSSSVASKVLRFFTHHNVILVSPDGINYHLSEREKYILHLMIEGHDFKSIAALAYISYETVRSHVKQIYKKLHVAGRTEAIMKAIQQGLS
ncbi:response regulator transcription factor [Flavihumibacter sp. ZG627]|uniref:response regulator transcription factor n=1 Tax=Flavihumibacter sp. ZG627 TaxID=1463156 RepID=UPI00057C3647|nr:response regulator transcription factor [Flavihumibacter sp. ZG627]KIC91012.1 hypothetical protein HY58_08300 [Flavihumibacter sp. ZG627]